MPEVEQGWVKVLPKAWSREMVELSVKTDGFFFPAPSLLAGFCLK